MGFQTADVQPLAEDILEQPGVSGVWILPGGDDRSCTMWVAVKDLNEEAHSHRMKVREMVEDFLADRQTELRLSGFVFDYHIAVDDPELGVLQIPRAAIAIGSAV